MTKRTDDMTLAYVVKGFWDYVNTSGGHHEGSAASGEMELMQDVISAAASVQAAWDKREPNSFDGVWDYEISEEFGRWLAEKTHRGGDWPTQAETDRQLELMQETE